MDIKQLIGETTDYDKKLALESCCKKKPYMRLSAI